ncbi:hydrogenase expression protein [Catellatospora methionotrophica]|uniref:Hydrogenase expression protein n=1 Tax=Catellatospora methionotrophica TaxID=121620 RepID=A0A8J3LCD3_9ACTN|nr:efflux RND transporter permease subunit [Catellatospora methionotrophica]GIG15809.1 hydrogenase expression protein [Catellatospora methionotrophica]
MSFLARLSLANRGLVALISVAILGAGAFVLPQLRQQMFPDLQFPMVSVVAAYPGATPEIVEQQVAIPIEQAVAGVSGVTSVTSTSRNGSASVSVAFDFGADIDQVEGDIQQALARIDARLPQNVDPAVFAGTTDDIPVIQLAASGAGGDDQELARRLRATVLPALNNIEGVRETTLSGDRTPQVTVNLDPVKLAARGLTAQAVTGVLTANGISMPGGVITDGGLVYSVAVGSRFTTVEQIADLYLGAARPVAGKPAAPAAPTQLKDVATVTSAPADATTLTRTNGKPSLGVGVTALPGANAVEISHQVNDKLPELAAQLGAGGALQVIFDQAPEVERSVSSLTTEGALGLAFAVLVILVFLLSVRSTLVTAVSIPVSVVIALIALWAGDYSLNLLTLGGLTIAIGRVVDDSIVVLENIKRHLEYGEPKKEAILTAVKEVSGAVTASTLTTVAVFLPVALVGGMVGQLFGPFGLTVTAALLASLLVSLTIVPVMAYWFLKSPQGTAEELEAIRAKAEAKELRSPLQRAYVPILRWSLGHRAITLLVAFGIIAGTSYLATRIETSFIESSGNSFSITQTMPIGTSLATTDEAAKRVETILDSTDGVKSYQVTVGGGGGIFGGGGGANTTQARFQVTSETGTDQKVLTDSLRDKIDALDDSAVGEVVVGAVQGGFGGNGLEVAVEAADDATLRAAAEQIRAAVAELPNVTEVDSDLAANTPQVQVTLDRVAAARAGLSDAALGQLVGAAFRGTTLTRVVINGIEQPVVLRSGAAPADIAALRALPIGPGFILDDVADVNTVAGPSQINRVDQVRTAKVTGTPSAEALGTINAELDKKLKSLDLPDGASYSIGGVTEAQQDAFGDLGLAMLVAIALVFIIMIATFRGLVQPLILLISVPFAATGALGLLAVTGQPLGLAAMIGLLMLVGIVVTNAIVLLDLINQYRADGYTTRDAIIEGGRRRLRPILMTAVATIFALLPMSLGLTESSAFISQPLAVVVIGGLVSSTLLTLVLVPVLYSLVEGLKARIKRKRNAGKHVAPRHEGHAEPAAAPAQQPHTGLTDEDLAQALR